MKGNNERRVGDQSAAIIVRTITHNERCVSEQSAAITMRMKVDRRVDGAERLGV